MQRRSKDLITGRVLKETQIFIAWILNLHIFFQIVFGMPDVERKVDLFYVYLGNYF